MKHYQETCGGDPHAVCGVHRAAGCGLQEEHILQYLRSKNRTVSFPKFVCNGIDSARPHYFSFVGRLHIAGGSMLVLTFLAHFSLTGWTLGVIFLHSSV